MAGPLAPVVLSDIEFTNIGAGILRVDISWDGEENSVDAHQLRTRWIAHDNGRSSNPPTMTTAGAWAESTVLVDAPAGADFQYIDTIEELSSLQMRITGEQSEQNEAVTNSFFANATVWAMSRLEVV